jgi:ketosteroid isomerase-like protein
VKEPAMNAASRNEDCVRSLFEAMDGAAIPAAAALMTDDVHVRFGNGDPIEGRDAFAVSGEQFTASIGSIRHEITYIQNFEDVVVVEMQVHYTRLDAKQLTLPCCNVFRMRDGLVADYRVYMDISPVYT